MAVIKESNSKKFSKGRTDLEVPAIARATQVAQGLSLTGSADIDTNNSENLYFHIMGALPTQILLFIYGEKFNQNFYTEIGAHLHSFGTLINSSATLNSSFVSGNNNSSLAHNHGSGGGSSAPVNNHHHHLWVGNTDGGYKIDIDGGSTGNAYRHGPYDDPGRQLVEDNYETMNATLTASGALNHTHTTTVNFGAHGHTISGSVASLGLNPFSGSVHTSGTAKSYFDSLKIAIDGVDKTAQLLTQASLVKFGDGTAGHVIVTTGVQLDLLPFISTPGQHKVTFSLNTGSPNNGGKIRYNFYTIA